MKMYGVVDVHIHVFLTLALVGGKWSLSHSGHFTPGERAPVPIRQEAGCAPELIWTMWRRENSWPYRDSNSDPSVVQPVASRYTDYAIPAPPWSGEVNNTYMYWHMHDSPTSGNFYDKHGYYKANNHTGQQLTYWMLTKMTEEWTVIFMMDIALNRYNL
jgi:hypothetical protein